MTLTSDTDRRKQLPLARGMLDYFPDALAAVADLSRIGNDKHNPGQPLHWSRGKSDDHADCIIRHMIDRGTVDDDGMLHDTKVAWRALAQLQLAIERRRDEAAPAVEAVKPAFTYWYLGTPYTRFPAGLEAAHILACTLTASLLRKGVPVYSPIAHTHPIAEHGMMDKVDHDLWVRADKPLLDAAGGLIVVKAESWEHSRGLHHEIQAFEAAGKPTVFWDPATDPDIDLLRSVL